METNKYTYEIRDADGLLIYSFEGENNIPNDLCSVSSVVDKNSELCTNIQETIKHIDQVMDKPVKVQDVLITKEGNSKTVNKQYESEDKMVSHPNHYQSSKGIEVIDVIEAFTEGLEGIEAVDTANAIKYICRWKNKNGVQDLEKTIWYVTHLINHLKNKQTI